MPRATSGPVRTWWDRHDGVRLRSALAAVVVVAVALAAGSVALFLLLERSLFASVESSGRTRATEVARLLAGEGPEELTDDLQLSGSVSQVVQVLGPDGRVLASSERRATRAPLSSARPAPGTVVMQRVGRLAFVDADDTYLVVARGVAARGTRYTVVVATSVRAQEESAATLALLLLLGVPVMLLVVGGATYLFVSRSLRPVERIRVRVAGISGRHLHERVPVPRQRDEIARLAQTMNGMLDRLQGAQETQHRFIADASHELRSPLATLRATLEVAAADPSGETWRDLHDAMTSETERMVHLVEDLLLLASADEDGVPLRRTDVDLDDVVYGEVRRLRAATSLTVTAEVSPARVTGDAAKLRQTVRNLADNAARYAEGQVRLGCGTAPGAAWVSVDDDGPGIPVEDRERVFDRFVRLDEGRERGGGGNGLGLAIVREIVAGHGGDVLVAESDLGGARLVLRLAATDAPHADEECAAG